METNGAQQVPPIEKMGARIRRLRKGLGLNQDQLAEEVGVQALAVGDWERGKFKPKGEHLVELARALRVPAHYVVHGDAGVYREAVEEIAAIVGRVLATAPPEGGRGPEEEIAARFGESKAGEREKRKPKKGRGKK